MPRETYTINAENKVLGRLAVEIVELLRGKNKPDFAPYKDEGGVVMIENINQLKVTGRKLKNKIYYHHSGYPGGLKEQTMQEIIDKKGMSEVLKRAVYGMLPKNKLRDKMIKRLKFK